MNTESKERLGCFIIVLLAPIVVVSLFLHLISRPAPVYETNDIADYGIVKGNYNNEVPKWFISSFFPEKIERYFSDVTYHYKAQKGDTYAYEMYLEFVIEDTDTYTSFLSSVIGDEVCEPFYFDPAYRVYYVSNYLTLDESSEGGALFIDNARVGLVLFSEEEQRMVFVALGLYDGGGTYVKELSFFFEKFGIDPQEYEERATPGYAGGGFWPKRR